jgi:anaerobic selenocysteine-containing dehydrogenase
VTEVVQRSYCRFCIAQCGILVTTDDDRVVAVKGDPADPISGGYTCAKGRALPQFHHHSARLDHPLLHGERVSWNVLLDDLHARVATVISESGPDAIAIFQATGSSYDANGRRAGDRLLRGLGSRSRYTAATVDAPAKMLVSELMAGHPGLLPAVDHDNATFVLLLGTNPLVSHGHTNAFPNPVARLKRITERGELWVVDPRRTETARIATRHLAPRPGTDYALLAFLVRELLDVGADRAYLAEHAEGVDRLIDAVERFDLAEASALTGLEQGELRDLLAAIRRHGCVAGQTGTGATMSAAANVTEWLMWVLHVITHSYEAKGGMWFHPGFVHRLHERELRATDGATEPGPASRPELVSRWGERPSVALLDEIEAGNVRALFVLGGNPLTALPEAERLRTAFSQLDVLVVADVLRTDTSLVATHAFPCTGQLERPDVPLTVDQFLPVLGTRYTPAIMPPSAERRPMWWPLAQLGRRLGVEVLPNGFDPDTATDEDLLSTLQLPIPWNDLRRDRVVVEHSVVHGWVERRLLPHGRWRIAPEPLVGQLAALQPPAPLVLVPRRQLRHLNSQLREPTATAGPRPDLPEVLVHPADAAAATLADGDAVEVRSATGAVVGRLRVDPDIRRGALSIPHGFAAPNVGNLTSGRDGVDPLTGMVRQSGVPVQLAAAPSGARLAVAGEAISG